MNDTPQNDAPLDPPMVIRMTPEENQEPLGQEEDDANAVRPAEQREDHGRRWAGKPRPGFWEAILWCVIFVATELLAVIVTAAVVFTIHTVAADNTKDFLDDQLAGLKQMKETPAESKTLPMRANLPRHSPGGCSRPPSSRCYSSRLFFLAASDPTGSGSSAYIARGGFTSCSCC